MTERAGAMAGDRARVSVSVSVDPETAFRVFTEDIDLWWRRGLEYRVGGKGRSLLHLEPHVGGRLFESYASGTETTIVETGRVCVWQPPAHLGFEWRAVNFSPTETTRVDVTFEPTSTGTRVTVTHTGWSHIRADHPVRHGHDVAGFLRMLGLWWGNLLTSLREHATLLDRTPPR